jgi:hypothetical protein
MWRHWKDQAVFAKVPPCGRARFKYFVKNASISPMSPYLYMDRLEASAATWLRIVATDTLDTLSANLFRAIERHHARLALQHAGDVAPQVSATMPGRVLGRSGTA